MPLDPADLLPGDVVIDGVMADAVNARGGYPVHLLANIPGAVSMRAGNTPEELNLSEWRAYADDSLWFLPTGLQPKTVYVEFTLADSSTVSVTVTVPDYDPNLGTNYPWPASSALVTGGGPLIWSQSFEAGHDYWVSYDFLGGMPQNVNVFYPTSWNSSGGVNDSGYIFADDSRWQIDTPEEPDQVFPFEIRGSWAAPQTGTHDFDGYTASFSLKGDNLDLKGGLAYFWVQDEHGRAINVSQPLNIGSGSWALNEVVIGSINDDDWEVSFLPFPGLIDPTAIDAWGVTFQGFSAEPTGVLGLDEFSIALIPDPTDPAGPDKSGSEITVKRNTGQNEDQPAAAALKNGGSVVVWAESSSATLYAQVMHADGSKNGARFAVAATASDDQRDAAVAVLDGGTFAVAWVDDPVGGPAGQALMVRLFNPDGSPAIAPVEVNADPGALQAETAIAALASGGFVVAWMQFPDALGASEDVLAQIFDADGNAVGSAIAVANGSMLECDPAVAALAGGGFVVVWEDADASGADGSGLHIQAQLFTDAGVAVAPSFLVNSTSPDDQFAPAVIVLSDGTFLVAWTDASDPLTTAVRARLFDATGAALGNDFIVGDASAIDPSTVAAVALPGGEYLLTWTVPNGAALDVHGQILSGANGTPISGDFIVNYSSAGDVIADESSAILLADGRILVAWSDYGDPGAGLGSAVRAQIFDQRTEGATLIGTAADDDWIGTSFGDTMIGNGGNDHMVGRGDDDWYYLDNSNQIVIEKAGQGDHDRILVDFNYVLGKGVYVEVLSTTNDTGTAAITLEGNEISNTLIGNDGGNVLDGDAGPNTLIGRGGNDWYFISDAGDVVTELAGQGTLDRVFVRANVASYTLTAGADVEIMSTDDNAGTTAIGLTGNEIYNTIFGNAGANTLDGGVGPDTLVGWAGDDSYTVDDANDVVLEALGEGVDRVFAGVSFALRADAEIEFLSTTDGAGTAAIDLTGNGFANTLTGNAGGNVLSGLDGADTLDGGAGIDTLIGGLGDDTYVVDDANDGVTELVGGGLDRVRASVSYALAAGTEVELLSTTDEAGTTAIDLTGNEFANTLTGNAGGNVLSGLDGADTLDGGAGIDTLIGGLGDDIYVVDDANDGVTELVGEGVDRVRASVSYALAAGTEVEFLSTAEASGTTAIDLTGNEFANTLTGNAGANVLDGKGGADTMAGGAGDDSYLVDDPNDVVTEGAGEGLDHARASVSYALAAGSEVELLSTTDAAGTTAIDLTGNEFANTLTGNAGGNVLSGLNGADTLDGGAGIDTLIGGLGDDIYVVDDANDVLTELVGEGADRVRASVGYALAAGTEVEFLSTTDAAGATAIDLTGNEFANTLTGNAGANVLDGKGGADTMVGGAGDDGYFVDNPNDAATEGAGQGLDHVRASVSYMLAAATEVEILSTTDDAGTTAINLTGNAFANTLTGNDGANVLDGRGGADLMEGRDGNDWYFVDDPGDVVIEAAGLGSLDRLFASASYTLGAGVEIEIFSSTLHSGTTALNFTGNELANTIYGNAGANVLDGGGGADTLVGWAGDDTYVVDDANDSVTELVGDGVDRVRASVSYALAAGGEVEFLSTTDAAGTTAIDLTGNEFANTLTGNAGANVLDGRGGADTMVGGAGDDTYLVDGANDVVTELVGEGVDRVRASVSYALASGTEVEFLSTADAAGATAIDLTGNAFANTLTGNAGANVLDGKGGADTMVGGAGDDSYFVDNPNDIVTEGVGGGLDRVRASVSYALAAGTEVEVLSTTDDVGTTAIDLAGNALANTLIGNAGDNVLDGKAGADVMEGRGGADRYFVDDADDAVIEAADGSLDQVLASVSYGLGAGVVVELLSTIDDAGSAAIDLTGNELGNRIIGNDGVNVLSGGGGGDSLDGRGGADTLVGGLGSDWYFIDDPNDVLTEAVGEGTDHAFASVSYVLTAGAEVEFLATTDSTGTAAINLTGNAFANILTGNQGGNILDGGGGVDDLVGLGGDDFYGVDDVGDTVIESLGAGFDWVMAAVSYTLGDGQEIEKLTTTDSLGLAALALTGNEFDNIIHGNAGANVLDGRGGADTLVGLGGDDFYFVDSAGDAVLEGVGGGLDRVVAAVSFTLAAGQEIEKLTTSDNSGLAAINLTGNAFDNMILGNAGANTLDGGGGADTLVGLGGNDFYFVDNANDAVFELAGGGFDRVFASVSAALPAGQELEMLTTASHAATTAINLAGNESDNTIYGNAGANMLDGRGGADTLVGLEGNDFYFIDSANDSVFESGGGGSDRVFAAVSYALTAGQEIEMLTTADNAATVAINLTGNAFDNIIYGNAGANVLNGLGGSDTLVGLEGNDLYFVDSAEDAAIEAAGQGQDQVFASASYALRAGSEVELLATTNALGLSAIDLTGNEFANTLTGNDGANFLDGNGGADVMAGRGGNDWYFVDDPGDVVIEAAGQGSLDRLFASASCTLGAGVEIEIFSSTLHSGTTALDFTGNELANTIYGNAGSNVLNGKLGSDSLAGMGGVDTFVFDSALSATGNVDLIVDFNEADDHIQLDRTIFSALSAGVLDPAAFFTGAAAHDADDRIIYDGTAGALLYDADGAGATAAVQFATLSPGLALGNTHFLIV